MRRGDVVIIAMQGDFGKPRPAVIVQNDALTALVDTAIVCPMTSKRSDTPYFRVAVTPAHENGLLVVSYVMADKTLATSRSRIGAQIGRLSDSDMARVDAALTFAIGMET
jgi:mRNA interferase MazF